MVYSLTTKQTLKSYVFVEGMLSPKKWILISNLLMSVCDVAMSIFAGAVSPLDKTSPDPEIVGKEKSDTETFVEFKRPPLL